ncbi:hypothetical protein CTKA_00171 [Chthonomonas calidirosea]|uniref:DUF2802 domain-containing protein n=1 Tax=Chthonomonas calidirosea (strain DSM 23976 / ICMP 18418 / T49) TaxID=1303518 RepID=S0EWU9_CHTCT|nr:hypothetical protein [Chthonomonas calidirosea]CCW34811.1 hypothetical protein CCALI_00989 [Chthonomonas calidirosea T49]CEK13728.1 hypothetical protein CTKA_00171 [Chthonomonas calidirosea]
MEWQAIGFALQILLLTVGWVLFQKARAELSVRAIEAPVLSELKGLQRNVNRLIEQLEEASLEASVRLERSCEEARELLASLERQIKRYEELAEPTAALTQRSGKSQKEGAVNHDLKGAPIESSPTPTKTTAPKEAIYALAEKGIPPATIAREVGVSEGEVETLLGLKLTHR